MVPLPGERIAPVGNEKVSGSTPGADVTLGRPPTSSNPDRVAWKFSLSALACVLKTTDTAEAKTAEARHSDA